METSINIPNVGELRDSPLFIGLVQDVNYNSGSMLVTVVYPPVYGNTTKDAWLKPIYTCHNYCDGIYAFWIGALVTVKMKGGLEPDAVLGFYGSGASGCASYIREMVDSSTGDSTVDKSCWGCSGSKVANLSQNIDMFIEDYGAPNIWENGVLRMDTGSDVSCKLTHTWSGNGWQDTAEACTVVGKIWDCSYSSSLNESDTELYSDYYFSTDKSSLNPDSVLKTSKGGYVDIRLSGTASYRLNIPSNVTNVFVYYIVKVPRKIMVISQNARASTGEEINVVPLIPANKYKDIPITNANMSMSYRETGSRYYRSVSRREYLDLTYYISYPIRGESSESTSHSGSVTQHDNTIGYTGSYSSNTTYECPINNYCNTTVTSKCEGKHGIFSPPLPSLWKFQDRWIVASAVDLTECSGSIVDTYSYNSMCGHTVHRYGDRYYNTRFVALA